LPPPFAEVIGVTFSFFVLVSVMGVVISLVAIPLRENVPILFEFRSCSSLGTWLESSSRSCYVEVAPKALQVVEISNT
jgi:hypothetical protein